jgi:transcriptional regulator with XRE-family HTH domain
MPRQAGSTQMAKRLGVRVRQLRQEVGLTQEKLAWECDLAKPYLSQLEAGKRLPSVPVLYRLAERLGVDVVNLLSVEETSAQHQLLEAYRKGDRLALLSLVEALVGGPEELEGERAVNPVPVKRTEGQGKKG